MIKHLACMMDGNRRWAKKRSLPTSLGHKEGLSAVERTVDFCLKNSISYLSLYTFSIENFKRSFEEKKYIFNLMINYFKKDGTLQELINKGIRILFIGDRSLFPLELVDLCADIEQKTAHNTKLTVNFLFCYGGRQEIVAGVKKIAHMVATNKLSLDQIDEKLVANSLWLSHIPDPELVIRPGGHQRLSNFLLYQLAYSELYFTETLWPDITEIHLAEALKSLESRQKNFGA